MRVLTIFALVLFLGIALTIGGALLIGRRQAPSAQVEWLHLTDCSLPCWNTITPRVSSLSNVQARIATTFPDFKHLSSVNLPFQTWRVDNLQPNDTSIEIAVDDGSVYSVNIDTEAVSQEMPTLGEVLAVFGAPLCVSIEGQSGNAVFTYELAAKQVTMQVVAARPMLYSPITSIFVGASKPFTCGDILAQSWAAFRTSLYASFVAS